MSLLFLGFFLRTPTRKAVSFIRWSKRKRISLPHLFRRRQAASSRPTISFHYEIMLPTAWQRLQEDITLSGWCRPFEGEIEELHILANDVVIYRDTPASPVQQIHFFLNLAAPRNGDRITVLARVAGIGWRKVLNRVACVGSNRRIAAMLLRGARAVLHKLRPLFSIQVMTFTVPERIGHLAGNVEVYLSERDRGLHGRNLLSLWVFCQGAPVGNAHLFRMWKRSLHVLTLPSSLYHWVTDAAVALRIFMPTWRVHGHRDLHGVLRRTRPHLSFTRREIAQGEAMLREMGVPPGAPFVCFHGREPEYLKTLYKDSQIDTSRYDYRDVDSADFLPAALALAERGIYCLRMGATASRPLDAAHPRIIDYATRWRTDFLDIFLPARCRFFLGNTSGLYLIPMSFRRPIVFTNFIPLEHVQSWNPDEITIFKKVYSRWQNRFLTARELLSSSVGRYLYGGPMTRLGLEIVNNTPEEIAAAALEMDDRLSGTWKAADGDEERQRRFWSQIPVSDLNRLSDSRIGADFLRRNDWLLG